MKTVWKYPIPEDDEFVIEMPADGQILTLQSQRGQPCIWVLVDPTRATVWRHFVLVGTGHQFDYGGLVYVGTFLIAGDSLVSHVFERP